MDYSRIFGLAWTALAVAGPACSSAPHDPVDSDGSTSSEDTDPSGSDSASSQSGGTTSAGTTTVASASSDSATSTGTSGTSDGTDTEGSTGDPVPCDVACDCGADSFCVQYTEGCGTPDCDGGICTRTCVPNDGCDPAEPCDCIPDDVCPSYAWCHVEEDGLVGCDVPAGDKDGG